MGREDEEDVNREGEGEGMASDRGSFREGTFTSRWLSARGEHEKRTRI